MAVSGDSNSSIDEPVLVVAAHADDEIVGAGGWLAGQRGPIAVAFLTDGTPEDPRWFSDGSQDAAAYRERRRGEARAAWHSFRPDAELFLAPFHDQMLAASLPEAAAWLDGVLVKVRPRTVLVPAFEGGHPDHDAANLLVACCRTARAAQRFEYALYTSWGGATLYQAFPDEPARRRRLAPECAERKRQAMASYQSQRQVLKAFDAAWEALRPLPAHDYTRPPRLEPCVYERWGWSWTAEAVAERFREYLATRELTCAS